MNWSGVKTSRNFCSPEVRTLELLFQDGRGQGLISGHGTKILLSALLACKEKMSNLWNYNTTTVRTSHFIVKHKKDYFKLAMYWK